MAAAVMKMRNTQRLVPMRHSPRGARPRRTSCRRPRRCTARNSRHHPSRGSTCRHGNTPTRSQRQPCSPRHSRRQAPCYSTTEGQPTRGAIPEAATCAASAPYAELHAACTPQACARAATLCKRMGSSSPSSSPRRTRAKVWRLRKESSRRRPSTGDAAHILPLFVGGQVSPRALAHLHRLRPRLAHPRTQSKRIHR